MKHLLSAAIISLFSFLILGNSKVMAQYYASLPYYTGFESGTLDSVWTTHSSLPTGEIALFTTSTTTWGTTAPYSGTYFLGMHHPASGSGAYNTNEAWLQVDLTATSNHFLEFYWAEFGDETEVQDGVFLSDDAGVTFVKVLDLAGASYTDLQYYRFYLNLDSMITAHGLTATSTFVIKFQQYDNYYFHGGNDGFLFDDVSVTACVTPVAGFTYTADSTGLVLQYENTSNDTTATMFWDFGDGSTSPLVNPSHSYASPGFYNVCLLMDHGVCGSDTFCFEVAVCGLPVAAFTADTSNGASVEFNYSGSAWAGLNYNWDFGDSQTGSGNPVTHVYQDPGTYIVTLTVTDTCGHVSTVSDTLVLSFTSLSETALDHPLILYPNPTDGFVTLSWSGVEIDGPVAIKISNIAGILVKQINVDNTSEVMIDASVLESGIYVISVENNDKAFRQLLEVY